MRATQREPCINTSLITLKIVVFFVITGITALHILHAIYPQILGLGFEDYRNISIIAPFVSIIGPLIAGPLADRFAAKNSNNFGRVLRFLTAIFLILAAIVYACLFTIPAPVHDVKTSPLVSFGCDQNGAIIFQERCSNTSQCHHWKRTSGVVNLTRCTYACQDPNHYEALYKPWLEHIPTPSPSSEQTSDLDYDDESNPPVTESLRQRRNTQAGAAASAENVEQFSGENNGGEYMSAEKHLRVRRQLYNAKGGGGVGSKDKVYVHPPHICITEKNDKGETVIKNCHAFTDDTTGIVINAVLREGANIENDTHTAGWCQYPLDGFQCNIPAQQVDYMVERKNGSCKPMIECQVPDQYEGKGSILLNSQCIVTVGNLGTINVAYTVIRILGDIYVLAALALLNTAIVIAVRETSEGRGEVCRQYAWGAIGFVLLFSLLDVIWMDEQDGAFKIDNDLVAANVLVGMVVVFFILGALVLLLASNMPLSPAEWWWHTKTGVMVYPMSAIRHYLPEIILVTFVSILFGTFWSSIHSYLKWTFTDQYALTQLGVLLVLVLLFNVDRFIEYCGHSNIFIAGFAIFIIRFTALSGDATKWLTVVMEVIEPLVIGVIWITIMLYMRHVMPRKLTATGQALAVLAFFGIGKGCGALIGLVRDEWTHNQPRVNKLPFAETEELHQWLAGVACIVALVYFIVYYLVLAPRCAAKPKHFDDIISGSASQTLAGGPNSSAGAAGNGAGGAGNVNNGAGAALNGNGNYSPLRVYHNERGKKGQFRF